MKTTKKINFYFLLLVLIIISCSSQEYTTAKLAIQQQDYVKAEEWLPKAMAVEPDNPEIPIVMAVEIHAKNGDWTKMIELFNKSLALDSNKVIEVRSSFKSVKETVNNYKEYYWANEFNSGVEKFKLINNDPDNKKKYLNEAISHFENASLINPNDANTHSTLSKCYFDLGEKDLAKKSALKSVEVSPESFDANFAAGQILLRIGADPNEVLVLYQKAVDIDGSNSKALRELASIHYDMGNKQLSIQVFKNAIDNETDKIIKADLYYNMGVIHNQMKNHDAAEKAFDEALFLNEDDFEAALGMAVSYEGLGDNYMNATKGFSKNLEKAARWYRKAEKSIKSVMMVDIDNTENYKKTLELLRYKREIAETSDS
ncbi:MAG: hypothetical protein CMG62_07695 [Candidatus Marinimicrobia bacterium]|nr:hypothetical protein [Candidatus Neomarinimicrobiota bacterium]